MKLGIGMGTSVIVNSAPSGLVAYYHFDGDLTDATGNGYDLSIGGGGSLTYQTGLLGQSVKTNSATPNYLALAAPAFLADLPIGSAYSVCAWMRAPNALPPGGAYVYGPAWAQGGYDSRFNVGYYGPWGVGGAGWYGSVETNGVPPMVIYESVDTTAWMLVVLTFDGAHEGKFYVNGALKATATVDPQVNTGSPPLFSMPIFAYASHTDVEYDELSIWSRKLSAEEIAALYNSGAGLRLM